MVNQVQKPSHHKLNVLSSEEDKKKGKAIPVTGREGP
jgi:hypothetical protein